MFIYSTIRTSFGPRSLGAAPIVRVSLTVRELHNFAALIDRESLLAQSERENALSERLAWRALRCGKPRDDLA